MSRLAITAWVLLAALALVAPGTITTAARTVAAIVHWLLAQPWTGPVLLLAFGLTLVRLILTRHSHERGGRR